ncbi:GtrA family protein [Marinobacterium mangrovicola]|uniref:Putative flippase GtrA n=1 Tax=Marinobacterium mangrovicola TaxID=1476959 RepID=A0A4R1HBE6_9GAMM|nr:GtrA family protein [Marinobacterium mangrovicola]TCK16499.1 putative flippase GtrA [Marinobacterium mangrovicola]
MTREALSFIAVGVSALLVHWLVVFLLVPLAHLHPLIANVIAFLVAFNVSYLGHRHLTFRAQERSHRQTLPRFATVAATSFLLNETMYWALLSLTPLRYDAALFIVLGSVALLTYLLGKFWAFA